MGEVGFGKFMTMIEGSAILWEAATARGTRDDMDLVIANNHGTNCLLPMAAAQGQRSDNINQ